MVKNDQEAHLNIGRENRPKEEGKNSHSEKAEGKPSKPKTGHPSHDEKNKEIEKDHTKVRGNKKYRNTEGQRIEKREDSMRQTVISRLFFLREAEGKKENKKKLYHFGGLYVKWDKRDFDPVFISAVSSISKRNQKQQKQKTCGKKNSTKTMNNRFYIQSRRKDIRQNANKACGDLLWEGSLQCRSITSCTVNEE